MNSIEATEPMRYKLPRKLVKDEVKLEATMLL